MSGTVPVEAKSRGGDTHVAYAASNERLFKHESNIKSFPIVAVRAVFSDFSARLADYVGRVEMNLPGVHTLPVYGCALMCGCRTSQWDVIKNIF